MDHLLEPVKVHNTCTNSHFTKIDLFTQLAGRPSSKSYQSFDFNRHNYDSSVQLLQQRFGKCQQIIIAHMNKLIKIPNCANEKPHSLTAVYDPITVHIRGSSAKGIKYGSLLLPMTMSKFPSETRFCVAI